jgi:endonuclease YncB( thermonuclease family)
MPSSRGPATATLALLCAFLATGSGLVADARAQAAPAVVSGSARVVDGDTLVVGRERVRLYGVDAPESKQLCTDARGKEYACGVVAKDALAKRVSAGGGKVSCRVRERDQYGRLVGTCNLGAAPSEEDAGEWMVSRGQAVAYKKITPLYVKTEEQARRSRQGIWDGEFEPPAKWRYERRMEEGSDAGGESGSSGGKTAKAAVAATTTATAATKAAAPPRGSSKGCLIKGNVSKSGEKIYHVPGDPTYEATKIDLSQGEMYFCSEEEAAAAGWRPSMRNPLPVASASGAQRTRR